MLMNTLDNWLIDCPVTQCTSWLLGFAKEASAMALSVVPLVVYNRHGRFLDRHPFYSLLLQTGMSNTEMNDDVLNFDIFVN